MIGADSFDVAQQIWINLVLSTMRRLRFGPGQMLATPALPVRCKCAHLAHVALHGFTCEPDLAALAQLNGYSSRSVERIPRVGLIDGVFGRNFLRRHRHGLVMEARSAATEQASLRLERQFRCFQALRSCLKSLVGRLRKSTTTRHKRSPTAGMPFGTRFVDFRSLSEPLFKQALTEPDDQPL